jgi:hypothetical protein
MSGTCRARRRSHQYSSCPPQRCGRPPTTTPAAGRGRTQKDTDRIDPIPVPRPQHAECPSAAVSRINTSLSERTAHGPALRPATARRTG